MGLGHLRRENFRPMTLAAPADDDEKEGEREGGREGWL